jgi:membrane associated rhomboid family serine protease
MDRAVPGRRHVMPRVASMQIDTPHPAWTASARASANFRFAAALAAAFVGVLWLLQITNWALGLDAAPFGIRPRSVQGLAGILFAPLAHGGFEHLLANTLPVLLLVTAMLHLYPRSSPVVLPAVYFGPGLAVWAFGRDAIHLGASGLTYGLIAHVFVAGMLRRDRRAIAASLVVAFLYGTAVWGVFPIQRHHSWETHLAAALIGVALALLLRHRDIPPPVRYDWEGEAGANDAPAASSGEWVGGAPDDTAPLRH